VQHLASRRQQIAGDLVSARETTERARQQLIDIDRRLKELPAELEAYKAGGAEEIAAEGVRIRQQAEAERHRLLEQTRRDIELQVRLAKQALADHTADLAVRLAKDRVTATITPADQERLVDRYVSDVKELHG
jgi:F0F1-type ATP synthase membrane subunit b/b'